MRRLAGTQMQIPPPTPLKRLSELGRAALNRLKASKHSDEPQKNKKSGLSLSTIFILPYQNQCLSSDVDITTKKSKTNNLQ